MGDQTAPPPLPGEDRPGDARPGEDQPRDETAHRTLTVSCATCGSTVSFTPGTRSLRCSSCGGEQEIGDGEDTTIDEHSFEEWLARDAHVKVADLGGSVLTCEGCGAQTETTDLARTCQFCGGHLVTLSLPAGLVPPEAVVPFDVDATAAQQAFKKWVTSRWLAPNALKKVGATDSLRGTYVPHWTFDAATSTAYRGERGDYYYVTRTRTVSDGKGGTRTETYQERKTRWSRRNGHVARDFDDVLVPATERLEKKKLDKMGPWRLETAQPYQPEFLSGFSALRYDVDPTDGSEDARKVMRSVIDTDVRRDIGGDEQRVHSMDVHYARVMFKLMLLPMWLAAYAFGGKQWQVMVNASTAEVVGDRPWSKLKISALVLLAVALIAAVAFYFTTRSSASDDSGPGAPGAPAFPDSDFSSQVISPPLPAGG